MQGPVLKDDPSNGGSTRGKSQFLTYANIPRFMTVDHPKPHTTGFPGAIGGGVVEYQADPIDRRINRILNIRGVIEPIRIAGETDAHVDGFEEEVVRPGVGEAEGANGSAPADVMHNPAIRGVDFDQFLGGMNDDRMLTAALGLALCLHGMESVAI